MNEQERISRIRLDSIRNEIGEALRDDGKAMLQKCSERGTHRGGGFLATLARIGGKHAKEYVRRCVDMYVEVLGPDLDQDKYAQEIARDAERMVEGIVQTHGRHVEMPDHNRSQLTHGHIPHVSAVKKIFEVACYEAKQKEERMRGTASPSTVNQTSPPDVSFVADSQLQGIAETNAKEACLCLDARAHKAATIMAGAAIETILLDRLQQNEQQAKAAASAPSGPLEKWRLVELIRVAEELQFLDPADAKITDWVRNARNYVHPGKLLRAPRTVEREEASLTVAILGLVCKQLR